MCVPAVHFVSWNVYKRVGLLCICCIHSLCCTLYLFVVCSSMCECDVSVERYIGEEGRGVGTIIQLAMLRGRGEWIYCIAIPEGGERHTSLFSGLLCSFSRSSRSMPVRLFGSYLALKILSKDSKYSSLTLLTRSIWNPKTLFELQNRYLPQHHNVRWVCHCVAGHMKITENFCFGKSPPPLVI